MKLVNPEIKEIYASVKLISTPILLGCMGRGLDPIELVRELTSQYVERKPRRITLKLSWEDGESSVRFEGEDLNEVFKYPFTTPFTSFAKGVLKAYREAYSELKVIPVSFREEVYKNDRVSLGLYPTGSAGVFDIFIEYRDVPGSH